MSFDMADESMIIHNDDLAGLQALLKSGRNGGTWDGVGLNTSLAQTDATKYLGLVAVLNNKGSGDTIQNPFKGQATVNTDVLIKYTWDGDANLDGVVNADDYFQIDSGFISQKKGYYNGDFNYDTVINADDYFLIDSAFIGQSGPLAASKFEAAVATDVAVQPKAKEAEPDGILSQLFSTEPVL